MKTRNFLSMMAMAAMVFSLGACTEDKTGDPDPAPDPKPTEKSKECKLLTFVAKAGDITLDGKVYEMENKVELVCLPHQFEAMKAANATATFSDKATIAPDLAAVRDFTVGVDFTVMAEDGKTSKTYKVSAIEGTVKLKVEKVWQKTFGDLGIGTHTVNDGGIAFSGDKFVAFDRTVHNMDGTKVGELNMSGTPNNILVALSNDNNGILVATVGIYKEGSTNAPDDIVGGNIWAWKDGWDKAPTKIYENLTGDVTRFMSVAGDVKGDAVLTFISGTRGAAPKMHHCFVVKNGLWPTDGDAWKGNGAGWNAFNVPLNSNDGNWSQQVSACSGDSKGNFFIFDSRPQSATSKGGADIYSRLGIAGKDVQLSGTLFDDGLVAEAAHGGENQYGNYSNGHVRGFRINDTDYGIVSSSSWGAANFTIQPADPSKDYLLRSQVFSNAVPYTSSAYRYNAVEGCGEILCMSASFEIIRYKIVQELL